MRFCLSRVVFNLRRVYSFCLGSSSLTRLITGKGLLNSLLGVVFAVVAVVMFCGLLLYGIDLSDIDTFIAIVIIESVFFVVYFFHPVEFVVNSDGFSVDVFFMVYNFKFTEVSKVGSFRVLFTSVYFFLVKGRRNLILVLTLAPWNFYRRDQYNSFLEMLSNQGVKVINEEKRK